MNMEEEINKPSGRDTDPVKQEAGQSPRGRMGYLSRWSSFDVPDEFDPDEISWVTDRIGITDLPGAFTAASEGHYVVNTADEIVSPADLKVVVDPREGPEALRATLTRIADAIDAELSGSENKVVVHCYMGMERSVIAVVWYLHKFHGLSLNDAYDKVGASRPIAVNHSSWIQE